MTTFRARSLAPVALLCALAAPALADYAVSSSPMAYAPLTGATPVTMTDPDDGSAVVQLGFTFPYYGVNFTSVLLQANGVLFFSATPTTHYCATDVCRTAQSKIPNTTRFAHNLLAPWWGDHDYSSGGGIRWVKPNANEIVIEYFNYPYYSASGTFNFQVRLNSSGLIQVHYGTHTTGTGNSGITAGFEDATGASGAGLLPCTATANCTPTQWPTNTLFVIGQPVKADIVVQDVVLANMVTSGANLNFTVSPTFRNFGQTAANNFLWKAYLSTNTTLEPGTDTLVFTATTPVSVASGAVVTASGAAVVAPKPAPGSYYVLVEADTTNVVDEFSDTNNVGRTANPFTNGLDLVAVSVTGPTAASPASNVNATVRFSNLGSDSVASVSYRVLLSTDKVLDGTDKEVHAGSTPVTGAETVEKMVSFKLPNGITTGSYYYLLEVDPTKSVPESNETNNVVASTSQVKVDLPDIALTAIEFHEVSGAVSRTGYLGQSARVTLTVSNVGSVPTTDFKVGVLISQDATLNFNTDTFFHDEQTAGLAVAESRTMDFVVQLPLVDKFNVKIPTGNYYIIGMADSFLVIPEPTPELNNVKVVNGPVTLKAPGADYTFGALTVPSQVAVGEPIPVFRVLRNIGNAEGTEAKYRFYASVNDYLSKTDFLLTQLGSGGPATFGTVTLAKGASDSATQYLMLPPEMPPGVYYLGCLVDEDQEVAELNEANNFVLSQPVQVGRSPLAIVTAELPDAMVDMPYRYQLTAAGVDGAATWRADTVNGTLPDGLTLDQNGLLSGTPKTLGTATLAVRVKSGNQEAFSRLVLRVLPVTRELAVSTTALPPAVKGPGMRYEARLGAAGGVMPYSWRIRSGSLPAGIRLSGEGVLSGVLESQVGFVTVSVGFEVIDSVGNHAFATLGVRVVEPTALLISPFTPADGMVGTRYLTDLAAHLASTPAPSTDVRWSLIAGALPPGLALTSQQGRGVITGELKRAGTFGFTVQAEDEKGRTDSVDLVISVFNSREKVVAVNPPGLLEAGTAVSFSFSYPTTGQSEVLFNVFSGELPPGLTLSDKGLVSGTVASDAAARRYDFVVQATDAQGGTGYGPFALEVGAPVKKGGCSAVDGGLFLPAALAALGMLARRRRR